MKRWEKEEYLNQKMEEIKRRMQKLDRQRKGRTQTKEKERDEQVWEAKAERLKLETAVEN